MSNSRAFVSVTSVQLSSLPSRRAGRLLLPRILCLDGFFSVSLDLTTPRRTNPKLRPHPIDLTHAAGDAKGGLGFSLYPPPTNLSFAVPDLADPCSAPPTARPP